MRAGRKRIVIGIATAVVLGGLVSVATADGGGGYSRVGTHGTSMTKYGHGYGPALHGMAGHGGSAHRAAHWLLRHQQDLGLTEQQVAKIKALSLEQDLARIRAKADVKVAERELRALVSDEKSDLTAIEAKVKEEAMLGVNLHMSAIKGRRDLFAVLTSEQREKQKAILERMHRAHRGHPMKSESQSEQEHQRSAQSETEQTQETETDAVMIDEG
ncbi:MAG: hypothetical protein NW703_16780 [Nitrospiraceae bacterium]